MFSQAEMEDIKLEDKSQQKFELNSDLEEDKAEKNKFRAQKFNEPE
jgi:hypothetical protein